MNDMKIILGGALLSIIFAGITYIFLPDWYANHTSVPEGSWACTTDIKICPDGKTVGRVPPYCHFASCVE